MYRYVSEWHSDDLMKDSISSGEESKSIPNEIDSEKEISPVRQSSLREIYFCFLFFLSYIYNFFLK